MAQSPEKQIRRAVEALQLLQEGSVFADAVLALKNKIQRQWSATKPEESAKREYLHTKQQVLKDLVTELKSVYDGGRLAVEELALSEGTRGDDTTDSAFGGSRAV